MSFPLFLLIDRLVIGGAQTQLITLAKHLPRERWRVEVLCFEADPALKGSLEAAGVPVTVLPRRGKLDWGAIRALRQKIAQDRPVVCHCWLQAANLYGFLASRGLPNLRLLLSVRSTRFNPEDETSGSRLWRRLSFWLHAQVRRWAVARGARIIVNAKAIAEELVGEGIRREAITIVPNGLSVPDVLEKVQQEGKAFTIISVFRLVPRKGGEVLLDAFSQLPEDCRLVMVGEGQERGRLEELARSLGVAGRVIFAGEQAHVFPWLFQADAFCLPSLRGEGISNALLEAMAAGLPVIGTNCGGTPEVIQNGQTGLLVPPGDVGAMATAFRQLSTDSTICDKLGNAAKAAFEAHYSVEAMVAGMEEVYSREIER